MWPLPVSSSSSVPSPRAAILPSCAGLARSWIGVSTGKKFKTEMGMGWGHAAGCRLGGWLRPRRVGRGHGRGSGEGVVEALVCVWGKGPALSTSAAARDVFGSGKTSEAAEGASSGGEGWGRGALSGRVHGPPVSCREREKGKGAPRPWKLAPSSQKRESRSFLLLLDRPTPPPLLHCAALRYYAT